MPEQEFDVGYVADLCRLELSAAERERFQSQLESVLAYMHCIDDFDVSDVEPMAHANPVYDVFREDEARAGLTQDEALSNAPQVAHHQFAVTKVVDA